jgi:outer membrane protein OmpA-like peptidoglycan-associated protein
MNFNFLDAVKGVFSNDLVSKAAGFLGESESGIKRGLDAVIPVSLAGIINKAQSAPESLFSFTKEAFNSGITDKIGDSFRLGGGGVPSMGPALITGVLGEKFGSIANAVSDFTGLKGSSVSSLFGSIVPLALGLLGKHATENNLSPGSLSSMLVSQKSSITSMLPSGLNVASSLPGFKSAVNMMTPPLTPKRKISWVVPLLLAAAALLLVWWLFRKPDKTASESIKVEAPEAPKAETPKAEAPMVNREPLRVKLPNGVELDAYKGGIEEQLIAFINDPASKPGNENWFDFHDLNFKFGTAEIVPDSRNELDDIVKILQAYPKVKIKIGGYADKVGDEAVNKKLSGDRAKTIADALKSAGVGKQVVGAEGYGSEFAKYPADAPEEQRIKDRRFAVSIRAK